MDSGTFPSFSQAFSPPLSLRPLLPSNLMIRVLNPNLQHITCGNQDYCQVATSSTASRDLVEIIRSRLFPKDEKLYPNSFNFALLSHRPEHLKPTHNPDLPASNSGSLRYHLHCHFFSLYEAPNKAPTVDNLIKHKNNCKLLPLCISNGELVSHTLIHYPLF